GFIFFIQLSYVKYVLRHPIAGRPLLFAAMLLVLGGFQFITMGLLGEMIMRTHHEVANKPVYKVKEMLN
ncbi:MAG: glycosyltransferase, partial [Candidatus Aureabacteria bacterium]|nr:glycosyltransferase [Candidatus Auribacterota bacterium]